MKSTVKKDTVERPSSSIVEIDLESIATILCPEQNSFRMASAYPRKTALVNSTLVVTLSTNASGAAGFKLTPYSSTTWINTFTGADYNPSSGAGTASSSTHPFNGAGTVQMMKLTALTVTAQSLANSNINGALYFCYADTTASNMLPISSFPNMSAYVSGNLYTNLRLTLPYTPYTEQFYGSSSSASNDINYYLAVVGGPDRKSVV